MTHTVLQMNDSGFCVRVVKDTERKDLPYLVYRVWNGHRRLLLKSECFGSVLYYLDSVCRYGMDSVPVSELIEWTTKNFERGHET